MWRKCLKALGPATPLGVVLGALFFLASLTPSLTPRSGVIQGVLGGVSLAIGYGIGVFLVLAWRWLGLPSLPHRLSRWLPASSLLIGGVLIVSGLLLAGHWQNQVHTVMGLAPVESSRPLTIAGIALIISTVLIGLGRLFRLAKREVAKRLEPFVPRRLAFALGLVAAAALFFVIGNDVVARQAFVQLDRLYAKADAKGADEGGAPSDPSKTGSPASLVRWSSLGAQGRLFVSEAPSSRQITTITGRPASDPLRIYIGLGSAETAQARAKLALDEAIRVGAFDRKILVLATPTGTGWMDPKTHFPLDVLTDGDVATVGVQYSYLASWLSLLAIPDYGQESARAVFLTFYDYWRRLPTDSRPRLYLFGLSLGAMNSDLSNDVYDFIDTPYQGAFYAGPPFTTRSWNVLAKHRDLGSPLWLPRFRDGQTVRFMGSRGMPDHPKPWGTSRFLYLQYASDGTVLFSPELLWRKPDWLKGQRGPDVSQDLAWIPVVTFLQVGFDLFTAPKAPKGHGHVYAGRDYMLGWNALLGVDRESAELKKLEAAMDAQDL